MLQQQVVLACICYSKFYNLPNHSPHTRWLCVGFHVTATTGPQTHALAQLCGHGEVLLHCSDVLSANMAPRLQGRQVPSVNLVLHVTITRKR